MAKVDVSYQNGWVAGRLAADDESDGHTKTVPGRHFRVRTERVAAYDQQEEGVLLVYTDIPSFSAEGSGVLVFEAVGTVAAMDKVMARSRLKTVGDDG